MGWAVGWDNFWKRDIGYGVPSICDHPRCQQQIDRGLAYVCGGEPYGGDKGCGLFFCGQHQVGPFQRCNRCNQRRTPFRKKPDLPIWIRHKLEDESWAEWRRDNPTEVAAMESAQHADAVARGSEASTD